MKLKIANLFFRVAKVLSVFTIPLTLSMSNIQGTNISKLSSSSSSISTEENHYYNRLTEDEKKLFEDIATQLEMGPEQRLNTLRYKFGYIVTRNKRGLSQFWNKINGIADFLVKTAKAITKDEIITRTTDWVSSTLESPNACKVGEFFLFGLDIASWLLTPYVTAAAKLIEFAYSQEWRAVLHVPDFKKCDDLSSDSGASGGISYGWGGGGWNDGWWGGFRPACHFYKTNHIDIFESSISIFISWDPICNYRTPSLFFPLGN